MLIGNSLLPVSLVQASYVLTACINFSSIQGTADHTSDPCAEHPQPRTPLPCWVRPNPHAEHDLLGQAHCLLTACIIFSSSRHFKAPENPASAPLAEHPQPRTPLPCWVRPNPHAEFGKDNSHWNMNRLSTTLFCALPWHMCGAVSNLELAVFPRL